MDTVPAQELSGVLARLERDGVALQPAFTAVADLRRAAVAGYEVALGFPGEAALTPRGWSLPADPPDLAGEIEARVLRLAIAQRLLLPPGPTLHITLSHRALCSPVVLGALASFGRLDDVVLVTDAPQRIDEVVALERALTQARRAGAVLALETCGGGYEALQLVSRTRADYVRVDRALIDGVAEDDAKAVALEGLVRFCSRAGSYVVAEGAARQEDLAAVMRLGVTLAVGPLFGQATPDPAPLAATGVGAIRAGAREQLRHTDLHGLIEHFPTLAVDAPLDQLADAFLADPGNAYLVLIDDDFRPAMLVERAALLHAEPFEREVTTVSASTPVGVAARRAVSRASADRFLPLVCCDGQGRYVGLVRVDGLLDALAAREG
jgi:EAL domain-containing protein (putative c-di-GMP-specific phosphodiesterase class I)